MPSVTYRKTGSRWHIRFRKKGRKEVVKSLSGSLQERTVRKKAAWYDEQWSLGRFDPWTDVNQSRITVGDALHEYLEEHLNSGAWAEKTTYRTNKNVLTRMLADIADKTLGSTIPESAFQAAFDDHPGGAYTKKNDRLRINGFLRWCHEQGYLDTRYKCQLPMDVVLEIRNTESIKYLTWQQVDDICRAHRWRYQQDRKLFNTPPGKGPDFYCDIWWFLFYSLLRKEELPKLRAMDLQAGQLRVQGKGRRTDTISLPPPARKIAESYAKGKQPDDPLFLTHMNRPKKHLDVAITLALGPDHPKGFHQFRHGGVVHYLSLGKPVQFVSKLARHKSAQVTLTVYGDVMPDSLEQAFADVEHRPATQT